MLFVSFATASASASASATVSATVSATTSASVAYSFPKRNAFQLLLNSALLRQNKYFKNLVFILSKLD